MQIKQSSRGPKRSDQDVCDSPSKNSQKNANTNIHAI